MPKPKRQRIEPTEAWEQLELLFTSPEQRTYELIRPVLLFGIPPKERAEQTGAAARSQTHVGDINSPHEMRNELRLRR